jgi:hypothetical protein
MTRRAAPAICLSLLAVLCAVGASGDGGAISRDTIGPVFTTRVDHCPFSFLRGMPPGVFCVYDGVAIGQDGHACGERATVIWSRLAPEFTADAGPEAGDVYLGFVTSPDLTMRGIVDPSAENRAEMADYTLGRGQRVRLWGSAEIRSAIGGDEDTEILSLRIRPAAFGFDACAFTSYDGAFVGVLALPPGASQ